MDINQSAKSANLLFEELREMATRRGPEAKLPTQRELCRLLKTNSRTLDTALSKLEEQRIIYRRHGIGIYVSPKIDRKLISILMDSQWLRAGESPFWGLLWGLFAEEAERRSHTKNQDFIFQLTTPWQDLTEPLPDNLVRKVEAGLIHGVISLGLGVILADWSINPSFPLVSFAGAGYWAVEMDSERFTQLGVQRLAALGCKRIGKLRRMAAGEAHARNAETDRHEDECFFEALRSNGLNSTDGIPIDFGTVTDQTPIPTYQMQGLMIARDLFGNGNRLGLDGLLVTDDMLTSGLIRGLRESGMFPSDQLKIATLSNAGSSVLFENEEYLHLIEFDPADIVDNMFAILDEVMAGRTPTHARSIVAPKAK